MDLALVPGEREHIAVGAHDDRHRFARGQPLLDGRSRGIDEGEVEAIPAPLATGAPDPRIERKGGEHREPVAHHVVEAAAVGKPRLREHISARRRVPRPDPGSEPWLGKSNILGPLARNSASRASATAGSVAWMTAPRRTARSMNARTWGARSVSQVSSSESPAAPATTIESFQARLEASRMPAHMPCPRKGGVWCALSPASISRPRRQGAATSE